MVESTGLPVQFWRYQSLGVKIPFSNMFSRKVEAENDKCVFRQGRIIDSSFYNMYRTVPKNVPHCLSLPSSHFCLLSNRYSKYECGRHPGSSRSANKKRLSIDFSGLVCKYCRTASNCYLATQVRKRSTAKNRKVLLYFFSFYFFLLVRFRSIENYDRLARAWKFSGNARYISRIVFNTFSAQVSHAAESSCCCCCCCCSCYYRNKWCCYCSYNDVKHFAIYLQCRVNFL